MTPDKEHPFLVNTGELCVRVLGTGFNVSAYREENVSGVTLPWGGCRGGSGKGNEPETGRAVHIG